MTNNKKAQGFNGLGIAPSLLKAIESLGFKTPTPIQLKSIPTAIEGSDLVGIAQTGTGKTLAFGIPMMQILAKEKGVGLVLLPTRELAFQVEEHLKKIGSKFGLRTVVLIGGAPIGQQIAKLKRRPHIIVATPGRLIDHINRHTAKLNKLKCLVLDEADMMLDMGFMPQVKEILQNVPTDRHTMLFSATMPPAIMDIARNHMKTPVRIEVAPSGTPAKSISQEITMLNREDKFTELLSILNKHKGSVLIFARTKHGVKNLCFRLKRNNFASAEIHSNRTLAQRQSALKGFKEGRYRILVATDIAARGLDINDIEVVVNFDMPESKEDYVHRIGRTARAGKSGLAISFATPSQLGQIKRIERLIKMEIPTREKVTPGVPIKTLQKKYSTAKTKIGGSRMYKSASGKKSNYGRKKQSGSGSSGTRKPASRGRQNKMNSRGVRKARTKRYR